MREPGARNGAKNTESIVSVAAVCLLACLTKMLSLIFVFQCFLLFLKYGSRARSLQESIELFLFFVFNKTTSCNDRRLISSDALGCKSQDVGLGINRELLIKFWLVY